RRDHDFPPELADAARLEHEPVVLEGHFRFALRDAGEGRHQEELAVVLEYVEGRDVRSLLFTPFHSFVLLRNAQHGRLLPQLALTVMLFFCARLAFVSVPLSTPSLSSAVVSSGSTRSPSA